MKAQISVSILLEDDDACQLTVEFQGNHYAGKGQSYFSTKSLAKEIENFCQYPIVSGQRLSIRGGYLDCDDSTKLAQEHLYLSLQSHDSLGALRLSVHVAEPFDDWTRGLRCSATAEFIVTYTQMLNFSREMRGLLSGEINRFEFDELMIAS